MFGLRKDIPKSFWLFVDNHTPIKESEFLCKEYYYLFLYAKNLASQVNDFIDFAYNVTYNNKEVFKFVFRDDKNSPCICQLYGWNKYADIYGLELDKRRLIGCLKYGFRKNMSVDNELISTYEKKETIQKYFQKIKIVDLVGNEKTIIF